MGLDHPMVFGLISQLAVPATIPVLDRACALQVRVFAGDKRKGGRDDINQDFVFNQKFQICIALEKVKLKRLGSDISAGSKFMAAKGHLLFPSQGTLMLGHPCPSMFDPKSLDCLTNVSALIDTSTNVGEKTPNQPQSK